MTIYINDTWVGTICGTTMVLLLNINFTEILDTIIIACIGAASSFIVSNLLRFIIQYVRTRMRKGKSERLKG